MNMRAYRLLNPLKYEGRVYKTGVIELPIETGEALVRDGTLAELDVGATVTVDTSNTQQNSQGPGSAGGSAVDGQTSGAGADTNTNASERGTANAAAGAPAAANGKPKAAAPAKKAAAKKAAK